MFLIANWLLSKYIITSINLSIYNSGFFFKMEMYPKEHLKGSDRSSDDNGEGMCWVTEWGEKVCLLHRFFTPLMWPGRCSLLQLCRSCGSACCHPCCSFWPSLLPFGDWSWEQSMLRESQWAKLPFFTVADSRFAWAQFFSIFCISVGVRVGVVCFSHAAKYPCWELTF